MQSAYFPARITCIFPVANCFTIDKCQFLYSSRRLGSKLLGQRFLCIVREDDLPLIIEVGHIHWMHPVVIFLFALVCWRSDLHVPHRQHT